MEPLLNWFRHGTPDARPDADLIAAFITHHDELAFSEVVRRHGPIVWGVCRRMLPDPADADDAFQATFLVLIRRGYRQTAPLGPWLYRVAVLTARKVRLRNARRLTRYQPLPADVASPAGPPQFELDGLLLRMPEKYRIPVILCHVEGLTEREAADRLQCPVGTLSARVSRGLQWLRGRAGVDPRVVLAGAAVGVVPSATEAAAVRIASIVQASQLGGAVPASVAQLVMEVSRSMILSKLRIAFLAIPTALLLGTAGVAAFTRPVNPDAYPTVDPPAPFVQDKQLAGANVPAAPPPRAMPAKEEEDEYGTLGPPRPGEAAWKAEFRQAYQLAEGQNLKIIAYPFPECRKKWSNGFALDGNIVRFDSDGSRLKIRLVSNGAYGIRKEQTARGIERRLRGMPLLETIENLFAVVPPLLEADDTWLQKTEAYADIVVREGASRGQLARDLQAELQEKCGIAVTLTPREEVREVIVASGKYVYKPRPVRLNCMVDVSASPIPEEEDDRDHSPMGSVGGGIDVLFRRLGWHVGMPVVNEVDAKSWQFEMADKPENSKGYLGCRWRRCEAFDTRPMDGSGERETVLRNVAEQTGLTFTIKRQKVWTLSVETGQK